MWQMFEIPWNQLPRQMIESCERGEREKNVINFIVHMVVNKMREIKLVIPSSAIKIVTKKIVDRFPDTFRDLDEDGVVIGDGTHSVFRKIQDRNNYLNRPHKRKSKQSFDIVVNNKKTEMSRRAGCTNWDPPVNEPTGSYMSQITENDEHLEEKLQKCFPEQRRFLNKNPSLAAIKKECPVLLTRVGATFHFYKLTNSDMANLEPAVAMKFDKFLKLNGFENVIHKESKLLTIIEIVARYFKEDLNLIYAEPNNILVPTEIESHPQIIRTGNTLYTYLVYYEKTPVNPNGFSTFEEAFQLAFAIYFNFNLKYPANISLTMEFIQRYFFKIHPDSGSKANKPSFSRVVNLMNKLRRMKTGPD
nr:uncharacterized protein LOC111502798 isoform X1 [Leptinotarsa decemlineata]